MDAEVVTFPNSTVPRQCAFCHKQEAKDVVLLTGPIERYICINCVKVCTKLLAEDAAP